MISRPRVEAMPSMNLRQVEKRQAAEAELAKSESLARSNQARLEELKNQDGADDDLSPADNVVVKVLDAKEAPGNTNGSLIRSTTEASFKDGNVDVRVTSKNRLSGDFSDRIETTEWLVSGDESSKTFFSSVTIQNGQGFMNANYSFEELKVTMVDGEPQYRRREGSGVGHRLMNGMRYASTAVGGLIGPMLSKVSLPSINFQFKSSEE